MDRGSYRDPGRPRSARVYRGSILTFLKLAALLLFCLAAVAGLVITADDGFELGRAAVTALMAAASLVMAWLVYANRARRVIVDDDGITSSMHGRETTLAWTAIDHVVMTRVNDNLTYTLYAGPTRLVIDDGLAGFEELRAELRERLGALPGE